LIFNAGQAMTGIFCTWYGYFCSIKALNNRPAHRHIVYIDILLSPLRYVRKRAVVLFKSYRIIEQV